MKIHWHKRAAAQLHQIEEYVLRDFGCDILETNEMKRKTISVFRQKPVAYTGKK